MVAWGLWWAARCYVWLCPWDIHVGIWHLPQHVTRTLRTLKMFFSIYSGTPLCAQWIYARITAPWANNEKDFVALMLFHQVDEKKMPFIVLVACVLGQVVCPVKETRLEVLRGTNCVKTCLGSCLLKRTKNGLIYNGAKSFSTCSASSTYCVCFGPQVFVVCHSIILYEWINVQNVM